MKIAVIGGGVAGLTAAHQLREKGYRDITVYEREATVGGKVCSYIHQGKAYELGALWSSPRYKITGELARRVGARRRADRLPGVMREWQTSSYARYLGTHFRPFDVGKALVEVARTLLKYRAIRRPSLDGVDSALCDDFERFSKREGFETLARVSASFFSGCGYLQNDRVPAIYLMKLMHLFIDVLIVDILGLEKTRLDIFEGGWQELWKEVAKDFDVRHASQITRVLRRCEHENFTTEISCAGGTETYDRLILAAPLDTTEQFMDLRSDERALFSKIRTHRYKVTLIEASSLPHASLMDHVPRHMMGHVNLIAQQHRDVPVFTVYQQLEDDTEEEVATSLLYEDVAATGGQIAKVITSKTWRYFPHISSTDLREGFYERMRALQGKYGTFYAGSIMSMETVEHTAQFSAHLVDRYF